MPGGQANRHPRLIKKERKKKSTTFHSTGGIVPLYNLAPEISISLAKCKFRLKRTPILSLRPANLSDKSKRATYSLSRGGQNFRVKNSLIPADRQTEKKSTHEERERLHCYCCCCRLIWSTRARQFVVGAFAFTLAIRDTSIEL